MSDTRIVATVLTHGDTSNDQLDALVAGDTAKAHLVDAVRTIERRLKRKVTRVEVHVVLEAAK